MQINFSPSINIERDFDKNLDYIKTPNSLRIFQQIADDYKIGTRSFTIIGSYGTGKSAFLWALEQQLTNNQKYFQDINGQFQNITSFQFLNIVGEYNSLIDTLARKLDIHEKTNSNQLIIDALSKRYSEAIYQNSCLVIVLDEFGKFLEFASGNNPERELYFIQQLAEFVNDPSKNVLLITVLHQSFDSYASKLNRTQRQEWEKVKGRLREIVFNEPVEQLLFLGAERLERKDFVAPTDFKPDELVNSIKLAKVFPLRTEQSVELAKKLYPLDLLSAAILTKALQTYGQNERSLFTFLESDDVSGLKSFSWKNETYFNLSTVYDYLLNNFSSLLTTKYNPHFFQWRAIQHALDRIEATLEGDYLEASKLVKIIGLINIFGNAGAKIDNDFLPTYSKLSSGIENAETILKRLEDKKIIRFLNYKSQYVLYEGTDLDIEIEVDQAAQKISGVVNIVSSLRHYFYFPYIIAKSSSLNRGTPRFFEFHISETPVSKKPKGFVDGIINLVFSEGIMKEDVLAFSQESKEAILFGLYQNTTKIKNLIFEIRKINFVLENLVDDRVAERELKNMLAFQRQELNHHVLNNLYQDTGELVWIYEGREIQIENRSRFNKLLSEICDRTYFNTPVFKNELINKERFSSSISKARKNLLQALVEKWEQEDLGFRSDEFPPEKTIYLTLLKETGIHRKNGDLFFFSEPNQDSFKPFYDLSRQVVRFFLLGFKIA